MHSRLVSLSRFGSPVYLGAARGLASALPKPVPVWEEKPKFTQLFINNEFVNAVGGKTFATINPTTGEKICDVQAGDKVSIISTSRQVLSGLNVFINFRLTWNWLPKQPERHFSQVLPGGEWTPVSGEFCSIAWLTCCKEIEPIWLALKL